MFDECGKKQPAKIKLEFAFNDTVPGKRMWTGFGTILCSMPGQPSGRKILPPHQFFNVLKVQLRIVVAEVEQHIVTVHVGVGGCETVPDVQGFSVFLSIPLIFSKI